MRACRCAFSLGLGGSVWQCLESKDCLYVFLVGRCGPKHLDVLTFTASFGQDLCPLIPIRHQSESADSELRSPLHPVGSLQGETPRCPVEVYGNQRPGPSCLTGEDQQNPPGEVPGIPWKSMEYMYKTVG